MTVTELVINFAPLAVLVLGWLWTGGKMAAKSEQLDTIIEKLDRVEVRLERNSVVLTGINGDNGVLGMSKIHEQRIDDLESRVKDLERAA